MTATLRYWAAAKAAAGVAEEEREAATLHDLLAAARAEHGAGLSRVLEVCSFLVDEHPVGARPHDEVALPDGALVDVLPPFAGG
jgi:molybdopterin converting factor small subunit